MIDAKMPQRWDIVGEYDDYMSPFSEGDYVRVEDVEPLLTEISRLRARVEVLEKLTRESLDILTCDGSDSDPGHYCSDCDGYVDWNGQHRNKLRAALKEAKP